jgi:hypothetical protein
VKRRFTIGGVRVSEVAMIRVHVWLPNEQSVGHSSAEIGTAGEDHATYVSWWPTAEVSSIGSVTGGATPSLSYDIGKKTVPDRTLDIEGLDEAETSIWWINFTRKPDAKYSLPIQNCSWAVVSALKAGGADKFFPWHQIFERLNVPLASLNADAAFQKVWERSPRNSRVLG